MSDVVAVRDAFVAYPGPAGTTMALRGLDLTVAAGERLLVQGPNGSGKSTLLRLLTGEQEVTAGRVMVGRVDLQNLSPAQRRRWRTRSVGMVDQHARRALLPEWPVVDNVALQLRIGGVGRAEARRRASATLARMDLTQLAERAVSTLSGGEAQRVAICAALAHEPQLILADEPTGELDETAAHQVYELLAVAGRSYGAALVLVSHDRRAGVAADRAVRLRDGRVAEQWFPRAGGVESQVLDGTGWIRLPRNLAGRAATMVASPLPEQAVRLIPGSVHNTSRQAGDVTGDGAGSMTGDVTCKVAGEVAVDLDGEAGGEAGGDLAGAPPPPRTGTRPDRRGRARTAAATAITTAARTAANRAPTGPATALPHVQVAVLPAERAPAEPALRMAQLSVRFGTRLLFDGLDLQIDKGQRLVLRGPSGCGKSTLLSLAAGLSDPTAGTVSVSGTAWQPLDRTQRAEFRRQHVAVALQSTVLAEALTVDENLRFAARLRALSTDAALEQSIAEVSGRLALTRLLRQPVQTLSGGERQRVAIGRCLVSGAGLLLLDEPTSQQDEASARRVSLAITEATDSGRAVLLATHDPILLESAGRLLDLGARTPRARTPAARDPGGIQDVISGGPPVGQSISKPAGQPPR